MSNLKNQDVIGILNRLAPKSYAFEGDKIGLHVGSLSEPVDKVMVTLDVLESVVDEAIEQDIDLIIAHHPLIFKPLKSIDLSTEKGRIIKKLINHNISVYVAHTNLDITSGGVNDMLMKQLNIETSDPLVYTDSEEIYKFAVYVPTTHEEFVRNAISEAGAGHIGNYSHCTFNSEGVGTFMPLEGTDPHIGSTNKLEKVEEKRMETIVPKHLLDKVVRAAEKAHPYEEMAYDLFKLEIEGEKRGLGRKGKLSKPMPLDEFANYVKKAFNVPNVRMVGAPEKTVHSVGVIGGDGNKFIQQVKNRGVDVLITGDVYYHTAHDALGIDLAMIDPGHHIEHVMKNELAAYLKKQVEERNMKVSVTASEIVTEPFHFI
ncbi:Nif3-like dinuclear metal center hexameric protein [Halalkalibacillus sediminis]|uniref:GTP cyclohydrolase 1 type 2 homolog n=1 Tax=Halalkalibacillus sediminis TaxID=2018042 RepID=A0A2I0QXF0_9BACI|nr:Nif3-like dinuclear metal center hexameric protein [Halalkalibacillus sediminis]PKR79013.1 Nif3-like dinuclear metal center hexameric protein [Halalkalibacillus sediminis]